MGVAAVLGGKLMKFRPWPVVAIAITLLLSLTLTACGGDRAPTPPPAQVSSGNLTETAPPTLIRQLQPALELYQPQITILSPKPGTVLNDATVEVSLKVEDLPLFTAPDLEIGPHLNLILDNQPAMTIYSVEKPITFTDLTPGTHSLRVFAATPWQESFKNDGAFAQTQFSVLTPNRQNNPDPRLPLLTYNSPQGTYGVEPILLDFYLTNAPLKNLGTPETLNDWRIRVTVNQQTFLLDRWQPLYLKGFKPGLNAVKLEFLNGNGEPVDNVFNNAVQMVNYQPGGPDPLAALIRGELSTDQARTLVDPGFTPDAAVEPEVIDTPSLIAPDESSEPTAAPQESPDVTETPEPAGSEPLEPEESPESLEAEEPEVITPAPADQEEVSEAIAPEESPEVLEMPESEVMTPEPAAAEESSEVNPEIPDPLDLAPATPEVEPEILQAEPENPSESANAEAQAVEPARLDEVDQPEPEQTEAIDPVVTPESNPPKRNWGEAFQRWRDRRAAPAALEPEPPAPSPTADPESPTPEPSETLPEPPAELAPTVE